MAPPGLNLVWVQVFYYGKVWEKAVSMPTWADSLASLWKGPGWFPGTPRLGDSSFVAERPVRERWAGAIMTRLDTDHHCVDTT